MGMWMVLVDVNWVCGWCWWISVGVWMVLGKLLSVFVTQRVSVGMWMVLMSVSGCVDGVGGCQWVCGWYW